MRHPILVLTALPLLFGSDIANADNHGWYIGIGFGDVAASYKTADFYNDADKRTTSSGTSDGTGIGFVSLPGGGGRAELLPGLIPIGFIEAAF